MNGFVTPPRLGLHLPKCPRAPIKTPRERRFMGEGKISPIVLELIFKLTELKKFAEKKEVDDKKNEELEAVEAESKRQEQELMAMFSVLTVKKTTRKLRKKNKKKYYSVGL